MLSGDIPESILLINTAEWQGQVRREVYFNSLLGAIPRMINVCVFSTQKQVKRFSFFRMSFPELAKIFFTFNSAFRGSNIYDLHISLFLQRFLIDFHLTFTIQNNLDTI